MMCRKQSSKWQSAKLLLVLPMVAISLSAFATTVYVETKSDDKVIEKNDKNKTVSNVRLEGYKIYLNDKEVTYDELATYLESNKALLNIKVANDEKSKEALAKVKELARQNQILTINYEQVRFLPAEDSEMQKPQDQVEEKVEKMPTFQGGDLQKFALWVYQSMKYPQEAVDKKIQGRVIVEFVVAKDGTVSSTKVLNNAPEILSAEAERVIKSSPKWEAGEHKGKKVNVKFVIPVVFKVTK